MKLTNRLNLPTTIVDAVTNDGYSQGEAHISITGLLRPPRIRVLEKQHADEITEDVSDRIFSLIGQVAHGILERAQKTGIAEKRFYMDMDGLRISGQLDAYYSDGLVQDYKVVSVYKVKDGVPEEMEQQQNCYAELLRQNGLLVTKLQLVCILRDWSQGQARREADIPQQQVVVLDVPLWPAEKAKAFLSERIRLHKEANDKLPECTPEERWARPDKWAVMKKGAKKALKLHETKELAEIHVAALGSGHFVEDRPGESIRCEMYCPAAKFCTQFQKTKK